MRKVPGKLDEKETKTSSKRKPSILLNKAEKVYPGNPGIGSSCKCPVSMDAIVRHKAGRYSRDCAALPTAAGGDLHLASTVLWVGKIILAATKVT